MIEIKTKIHDKFSIEFKVGFVVPENVKDNNFAINTWIFVPNSLDINPQTYPKELFYRDVKSNVRLITPSFIPRDIVGGKAVPMNLLKAALDRLASNPSRENIADYEYQIKMFCAIVKSSLRDESYHISACNLQEDLKYLCDSYSDHVGQIISTYRRMRQIINIPTVSTEIRGYYVFGDEFLSHIIEHYSFRVLTKIDGSRYADSLKDTRDRVARLIRNEGEYKKMMGFTYITPDNPESNRYIVFRHSILKKYIESDLYIKLKKKRDGQAVEQIYMSVAAGVAMIFATIVAFAAQRRFANFSGPLFVTLVVSYMLKDRIKDLTRYYFAHKLGKKYFDNKATISIKEQPVGWMKEGVDFITDDKAPGEVMEVRSRTPLLAAENRISDEKIILYRKLVYIDGEELSKNNDYHISGINDIMRLHITRFTQKMDDPMVPLRKLREDGSVEIIYTEKIYYINIVMQFQYDNVVEYKRFRVVVTRNGILGIQEVK